MRFELAASDTEPPRRTIKAPEAEPSGSFEGLLAYKFGLKKLEHHSQTLPLIS